MQSLSIIREEHHAIASMLQGLSALVRGTRESALPPNFGLLHAMLYYVESFPERLHHPKEEQWLFRLLALRHPPARPLLDLLCEQHQIGTWRLALVKERLHAYEQQGASAFADFASAVDDFVAFEREHMGREEREAFPLAQQHLTDDDWEEIDEAFAAQADPLQGVATDDGFADLHARLERLPVADRPDRPRKT
ncbi:MAG: hemerythrin domain-containing protein [Burkholderiales bacterium]